MRVSLAQQIEELERERKLREGVYPRQVASGKLRQSVADYQIARLEAAKASLAWLAENEFTIKQRLA